VNLLRYWHTLKYLRPIQIYGRVWFSLYKPIPDLSPPPPLRARYGRWVEPARLKPSLVGPQEFYFCGTQASLDSVGWDGPDMERLWRYNQHYFEDLVAQGANERRDWHQALVHRWVTDNPPGKGVGWEPYPTSRRIINWIKWALEGGKIEEKAIHSLAVQARWLEKRIEWHLLGNHLLANATALIFAGIFFEGSEAERWLQKGIRILDAQLTEQILEDGGHFELSPMYHAVVLRDMLDLYNLATVYSQIPILKERLIGWTDIINRMRRWLLVMSHPDGDIAFFNDAAFGVAPSTAELENYSYRLGLQSVPSPSDGVTHLKQSGYIRLQGNSAVAILDCAPIGPDYQPGHAHADTLSFELSVGKQRVLVNSGTSTYEAGEERMRQRGTASHNTVTIDGQNSSEVWACFRVARRANLTDLSIEQQGPEIDVRARHDGYYWLKGSPVHERYWFFSSNKLSIEDRVRGKSKVAVSRFHIHPECMVGFYERKGMIERPGLKVKFEIEGGKAQIEGVSWYPQFGQSISAKCLSVYLVDGRMRTTFSFS